MSYYTETITEINSPLIDDYYGDLYDENYDYLPYESIEQLQKRMLLILGLVTVVAISLGLFVLQNGINSSNPASSSTNVGSEFTAITNQEVSTLEIASSTGNGGIAPFFTPEVQYWESSIIRWSQEHNLDPNAIATIMQIESCGDPQAVSIAGAQGLFQVMPFHFDNGENMQDPDTNATRGLNFLNEQLRFTGGDINLSFAGYNGGYAASGGNYENWANETQRYYQWAAGIYEDARSGADSSDVLNSWLEAGGSAGCERASNRLGL